MPQHPLLAFHKLNFLSAEPRLRQGTLDILLNGKRNIKSIESNVAAKKAARKIKKLAKQFHIGDRIFHKRKMTNRYGTIIGKSQHNFKILWDSGRIKNSWVTSKYITKERDLPTQVKNIEYKEFNLGGQRGYTRVRYEAPEGKTQGKGGYYYAVTNDGEQVHVKGKKKVRTVLSYHHDTSVSADRRSRFFENKSNVKFRTFVVNHKLENKLMF